MDISSLRQAVFAHSIDDFETLALEVFHFQSEHCKVYQTYLDHLHTDRAKIKHVKDIPYLPIEFFKYFNIQSGDFTPSIYFESSSTTGTGVSKHLLDDEQWYIKSCTSSFNFAFGDYTDYCHLALLPSYLERKHSSLVYQVNHFIQNSKYPQSAFFLNDKDKLYETLLANEVNQIPTMFWGVSFALLDFIEQYQLNLKHTTVLETGGMKGRRKEMTREELHAVLMNGLGVTGISGEYGMTELMSQAYSLKNGIYKCPDQMRISIREINDPLSNGLVNRIGAVNVIDLANIHSCSFIATSDLGKVYTDGSFEILGRLDYSDTRGCNLLVV
jgi:hypothetical protein